MQVGVHGRRRSLQRRLPPLLELGDLVVPIQRGVSERAMALAFRVGFLLETALTGKETATFKSGTPFQNELSRYENCHYVTEVGN